MAGLIYYDADVHAVTDLYDILKSIPNFWDSTDDEASELTKGGITLNVSGGTRTAISGYGMSQSINLSSNSLLIAATERGLVVYTGTGTQTTAVIAIGCDKDGNWAGSVGGNTNPRVNYIVAEGVSSTDYGLSANIQSSATMTQIIDLATDKGNFIFDDLRRVLMCPVTAYNGKLTMPNGEKYVKCGAYALRYTE